MKKIYTFTLSLLLVSSSILYSNTQEPSDNTQDTKTIVHNHQNTGTQYCQEDNDELDNLIDDAINSGVVSPKIEFPKPSKFETLVRKLGVFFFLRPYIYVVTKYRATKKLVSHYAKILWAKIKPEQKEAIETHESQ